MAFVLTEISFKEFAVLSLFKKTLQFQYLSTSDTKHFINCPPDGARLRIQQENEPLNLQIYLLSITKTASFLWLKRSDSVQRSYSAFCYIETANQCIV